MSTIEHFLKKAGIESDEQSAPTCWLDTGLPNLNEVVSGDFEKGLPSGRVIELSGGSSSGKTMLSTQVMKSAQNQGGFAAFFDHEHSYDGRLSLKQGMSLDPSKFLYRDGISFEGSIVDAQKIAVTIRENKLIEANAPIVFVFDSLAAMVPLSKLSKDVDAYTMNDTTALARATSAVLPAFATKCKEYNVCAIFINQLRDTMDMYGPKEKTAGGKAIDYYTSVRIKLSGKLIKEKTTLIRNEVTATIIKNKVSAPFKEAKFDFVFNEDGSGDFDVLRSYANYLADIGCIERSGSRVKWEDGSPYMSEVIKMLRDDTNAVKRLQDMHRAFRGRTT